MGHRDPFRSVAEVTGQSGLLIDNLRVETVRSVGVDTADNGSPAGDGKTSRAEALQEVCPIDRITFNIQGAWLHDLLRPTAGYSMVEIDYGLMDGFSQPGAAAIPMLFSGPILPSCASAVTRAVPGRQSRTPSACAKRSGHVGLSRAP